MSAEHQEELVRPLTEQEVVSTIKWLNGEGVLGLDGFLVFFFRELWEAVKEEVLETLDKVHRVPQQILFVSFAKISRGGEGRGFLSHFIFQLYLFDHR